MMRLTTLICGRNVEDFDTLGWVSNEVLGVELGGSFVWKFGRQ